MKTHTVSLTELKQNLGSFINQAAYSGDRIVLLSHGKERAALISLEDLRLLEAIKNEHGHEQYRMQQQEQLSAARQLRERMWEAGYQINSTQLVEEVREERLDDLMGLR